MNANQSLVLILVLIFVVCGFIILNEKPKREGFFVDENTLDENILDNIGDDLDGLTDEQKKEAIALMQKRLIQYGALTDMSQYAKKSDIEPNNEVLFDESKHVPKSAIEPSGPRIDMSKYVLKSSIPPQTCPPREEIDYSEYVKKSTLPPIQKCPPCISPKVKVSAGLVKNCPPAPKCPEPEPCPVKQCPEPEPCPAQKKCPEPEPCPTLEEQTKCSEIKYIKVPTIITRTIKVDRDNKVISEEVEEEQSAVTEEPEITVQNNPLLLNVEEPKITVAQETRKNNSNKKCGVVGLNSDFKKFGVYGYE